MAETTISDIIRSSKVDLGFLLDALDSEADYVGLDRRCSDPAVEKWLSYDEKQETPSWVLKTLNPKSNYTSDLLRIGEALDDGDTAARTLVDILAGAYRTDEGKRAWKWADRKEAFDKVKEEGVVDELGPEERERLAKSLGLNRYAIANHAAIVGEITDTFYGIEKVAEPQAAQESTLPAELVDGLRNTESYSLIPFPDEVNIEPCYDPAVEKWLLYED